MIKNNFPVLTILLIIIFTISAGGLLVTLFMLLLSWLTPLGILMLLMAFYSGGLLWVVKTANREIAKCKK